MQSSILAVLAKGNCDDYCDFVLVVSTSIKFIQVSSLYTLCM